MSHDVEIGALGQDAAAVVARAAAGETVTVADRRRPVARLTPIPRSPLEELLAVGDARPPRRPAVELAYPRHDAELSDQLAAMREAERC